MTQSTPIVPPAPTAQTVCPIFHITHWKAGSEWVRAVLNGLAPERFVPRRQSHKHLYEDPIRPDGLYSPVYLHRQEFNRIVTIPSRRFVVIRDLRDTLVSWYFSERFSHPTETNERLAQRRAEWEQTEKEEGLMKMLETSLAQAARIQLSWVQSGAQGGVQGGEGGEYIVKYEDLWADQLGGFVTICEHIGLDVSRKRIAEVVEKMSFESRSGGRKPGEEDVKSHFRKGLPGDWRNHFTPRITEAFKSRYGQALIATGYEQSLDW
jgi:hypothetical protein